MVVEVGLGLSENISLQYNFLLYMSLLSTLLPRRHAIWPTLPLNVYAKKHSKWVPFPLNEDNCRIYSRARHAIWNACKAYGLEGNDVILVPAYHHGSEIEALLQAGLNIRYYEIEEDLTPNSQEIESLLDKDVKALYLIHYLGFPQDTAFWRRWCDDRNILLFEDAAQAFLAERDSNPVGKLGHIAIYCLYKTYGIPDGGAVISNKPPSFSSTRPPSGTWGAFKRHVNWIAAHNGSIGLLHLMFKPLFAWWKRINEEPHAEFDLGDPFTPLSKTSAYLLPKVLSNDTSASRRENYLYLLRHLTEMVPKPFSELPEGACPFAFPIEVYNAGEFLERLRHKGILGLLFWKNPHPSLPVDNFPRSKALRERVLALPVHQELTSEDLKLIVESVKESIEQNPLIVAIAS